MKSRFRIWFKDHWPRAWVITYMLLRGLSLSLPANAATGVQPVDDLISLANDALTWILIVVPVTGAAAIGWYALQRQFSHDHVKMAESDTRIKQALWGTGIAESATGLIKIISSHFAH